MYLTLHDPEQTATTFADADRSAESWLLMVADRHASALDELLAACCDKGMSVCGVVV